MRTLDELRQFYAQELLPVLQSFEGPRHTVIGKARARRNFALGIGLAIMLISSPFVPFFPWGAILGFTTLLAAYFAYSSATFGYRVNYKLALMNKLVPFLDPDLRYSPFSHIPQAEYDASQMFPYADHCYIGEDMVSGKIAGIPLSFSELFARAHIDNDLFAVFQGVFFVVDFNKNFSGQTFVRTDFTKQSFSKGEFDHHLPGFRSNPATLVKLEDLEFERLFMVHSTDQVEARYILSTALMRRITQYRLQTRRLVELSFIGNKVYIALWTADDLFEANPTRPATDFAQIKQYYDDLRLTVGIVEELNLNTRIWSKR